MKKNPRTARFKAIRLFILHSTFFILHCFQSHFFFFIHHKVAKVETTVRPMAQA